MALNSTKQAPAGFVLFRCHPIDFKEEERAHAGTEHLGQTGTDRGRHFLVHDVDKQMYTYMFGCPGRSGDANCQDAQQQHLERAMFTRNLKARRKTPPSRTTTRPHSEWFLSVYLLGLYKCPHFYRTYLRIFSCTPNVENTAFRGVHGAQIRRLKHCD